jgi:hypothetical protein
MRERSILTLFVLTLAATTACKRSGSAGADEAGAAASGGAAPATSAASDTLGPGFEGAITLRATSSNGRHGEDITFLTKGGKLRIDEPVHGGQAGHVIFDTAAKKMLILVDSQKMYMEMDPPSAGAVPAHAGGVPPKVTDTGKHDTVAGNDCVVWEVTESNGKRAEVCVAKGVGFFDFMASGPQAGAPRAWADMLKAQGGFPLRMVETDATGKETSRMVATKIEKKTLDASLFEIPAGYRPMQIPHFGGMPSTPNVPNTPHRSAQ